MQKGKGTGTSKEEPFPAEKTEELAEGEGQETTDKKEEGQSKEQN